MLSWERAWPEPETGASCISCWSSSPFTNTSTEPSSVVLSREFFHQLGCPGSHYRMCHGSASTKLRRSPCLTAVMINPTRCALSIVENFKFQNLFIFPPKKKWLKHLSFLYLFLHCTASVRATSLRGIFKSRDLSVFSEWTSGKVASLQWGFMPFPLDSSMFW